MLMAASACVIDVQRVHDRVRLVLSPPLVHVEAWIYLTPANLRHVGAVCFQAAGEAENLEHLPPESDPQEPQHTS